MSKKEAERAEKIGATALADQHDGSAQDDDKPTSSKDSH